MADSFDPLEYLTHLRRNGKFAVVAVTCAAALTLTVSLLLPKQYTATATLVIEPPVANDPRAATAVTPVYLESLKTYEQFASSDTLFAKACAKFGLAETPGAACTESFKRQVLRVAKLKDTKVMQVRVTLPDAKRAQQLAEYLAAETVALNRTLAKDGDRETQDGVQAEFTAATEQLRRARGEFEAAVSQGAVELLEEEIRTLSDLKARTNVEALRSRAALAELNSRKDAAEAGVEQARLNVLTGEAATLDRQLAARSATLATARARRERAGEALRIAEAKQDAWSRRANDAAVASGLRTEQLRVVDPGVIPQQPSFPNIPLFTGAAILISALLALSYLSLQYGVARRRMRTEIESIEDDYKAARGGHR
jgi:succinoglycan biosynthesis transport protein ExoP